MESKASDIIAVILGVFPFKFERDGYSTIHYVIGSLITGTMCTRKLLIKLAFGEKIENVPE